MWYDTNVLEVHAASMSILKMEAAWTSETLVSYHNEHYTASQPRRIQLERYHHTTKRFYSERNRVSSTSEVRPEAVFLTFNMVKIKSLCLVKHCLMKTYVSETRYYSTHP
jgi:hypothetical protein